MSEAWLAELCAWARATERRCMAHAACDARRDEVTETAMLAADLAHQFHSVTKLLERALQAVERERIVDARL